MYPLCRACMRRVAIHYNANFIPHINDLNGYVVFLLLCAPVPLM